MPIRRSLERVFRVMAFRRAAFEGERDGLRRPIAAPEDDFVIGEVMPGLLAMYGDDRDRMVVPQQRPVVFCVVMIQPIHPRGHSLRLGVAEARGRPVKQVVVCVKTPAGRRALVLLALAVAGQRTFENVPEVEDVLPIRQERMRDVKMHPAESWPVV